MLIKEPRLIESSQDRKKLAKNPDQQKRGTEKQHFASVFPMLTKKTARVLSRVPRQEINRSHRTRTEKNARREDNNAFAFYVYAYMTGASETMAVKL